MKESLKLVLCSAFMVMTAASMCMNAAETGGICAISFDGTLRTSRGRKPLLADSVSFTDGKTGRAAFFGPGSRLAYPVAGNYDPKRGAVQMWVRPDWDGTENTGDKVFWVIDNDTGLDNRTVLGYWSNGKTSIVYFSNPQGVEAVRAPVQWKRGEWHKVLACWDEETAVRALWVDDEFAGSTIYTYAMPAKQQAFYVGYLPGTVGSVTDGLQADAAIDEFQLHGNLAEVDFERALEPLAARVRARGEALRRAQQLREEYSLERVAAEHIEVGWDDLLGIPPAFTKRVPVQARYHPEVVFVQPDLSISLGNGPMLGKAEDSLGLGFALGVPPRLPDMHNVTRKLRKDYQPILESHWTAGPITVEQTAFALLPRDEETVTGKEKQYAVVRMALTNTQDEPRSTALVVLVGRMGGSQNTLYAGFEAPASRWQADAMGIKMKGQALVLDDRVLLTYRTNRPARVSFHDSLAFQSLSEDASGEFTNCLRFALDLRPNETRTIDFVAAGTTGLYPAEELERMSALSFEAALERADAYWDRALQPGMKLVTPDKRINDIYRHLILSSLGNIAREPERPWIKPLQAPILPGVWPWEFAHMAVPMMAIGYHRELEPAIAFFIERQNGIGPYDPGYKPDGDIASTRGCFTGNWLLWMSETGGVLRAMAARYRYSRDVDWLKKNTESIVAAWDWIQTERARTRLYEDGRKVDHYGLLPKGRVHDWEGWRYHFAFTDGWTWRGMAEIAAAFGDAGLPEAARFAYEADEYRTCILDVLERIQFVDPETDLLFVPNTVYYREGSTGGVWWSDGPLALFAVGLLDPTTDERFEPMLAYLKQTWGVTMGLMNRMDPGQISPYIYVNSTEPVYYRCFLARGEFEKALLVFYSNLVYSMSHDCYQLVERIDVTEANYAPFQPNSSGNGRIIDMMRRMVIDEQEPGMLWLLRGCPRRWFAAGESITVEDAPTVYGRIAIHTDSDGRTIRVDLDAPVLKPPKGIRLVVRHGERKPIVNVAVNGKPGRHDGEVVIISQPTGRLLIECTY